MKIDLFEAYEQGMQKVIAPLSVALADEPLARTALCTGYTFGLLQFKLYLHSKGIDTDDLEELVNREAITE